MIVVFDFDKTLTCKDTLFGFFRQFGTPSFQSYVKQCLYVLLMVLHKLDLVTNTALKRWGVGLFLKGELISDVAQKAKHYAGQIRLSEVHDRYFVRFTDPIVVSGSLGIYVSHVFPGARVVASEVSCDNGVILGLHRNCFGEAKRIMLREASIERIDVLFTDNKSDLPMAEIAEQIYFVRRDQVTKCRDLRHFLSLTATSRFEDRTELGAESRYDGSGGSVEAPCVTDRVSVSQGGTGGIRSKGISTSVEDCDI